MFFAKGETLPPVTDLLYKEVNDRLSKGNPRHFFHKKFQGAIFRLFISDGFDNIITKYGKYDKKYRIWQVKLLYMVIQ